MFVSLAFAETVAEAFPPRGERVPADAYGEYLRALPLKPEGSPVRTYDGDVVVIEVARVVDMPLVAGDLQQCADSALRLRATWLRSVGEAPAFHYTSGWLSSWASWEAGERPRVSGSTVTTVRVTTAPTFDGWLRDLFMYAGTRSLVRDTVPVTDPRPGDMLLAPGSPGHVVVLLDVTDTHVLVAQGFMPAMDFHVLGWLPRGGDTLASWPIAMPWSGLVRWR